MMKWLPSTKVGRARRQWWWGWGDDSDIYNVQVLILILIAMVSLSFPTSMMVTVSSSYVPYWQINLCDGSLHGEPDQLHHHLLPVTLMDSLYSQFRQLVSSRFRDEDIHHHPRIVFWLGESSGDCLTVISELLYGVCTSQKTSQPSGGVHVGLCIQVGFLQGTEPEVAELGVRIELLTKLLLSKLFHSIACRHAHSVAPWTWSRCFFH